MKMLLLFQFISLLILIFSCTATKNGNSIDGHLLISDGYAIRLYNSNAEMLKVIAQKNAQSIDYDCSNNEIVWTNFDDYMVYIKGNELTTLPKPMEQWIPKSVAVDSINHKIYVAESLSKSIFLYDKENRNYTTVFQVNRQAPYFSWQVVVDPREGYLFIQSDYEIVRTDLYGTNSKVIYLEIEEGPKHESKFMNMTRFSIDTQSKRLFWLNDETGQIWSMNYEGKNRKINFERKTDKQGHMFDSVTVINDILFWADTYNQNLIKINLNYQTLEAIYDLKSVVPESIKGVYCEIYLI